MKILFLCPDYLNIHKIIEEGISVFLKAEVKTIVFQSYQYRNINEKIKNTLSKLIFKKNLKKIWASKMYYNQIDQNEEFDFVFVISPDYLTNYHLGLIKKKSKKMIVYFWDSFDWMNGKYERTLPFFDKKFSFEPKDCEKYNLELLTNFYYDTTKAENIKNNAYYIGNFDNRINVIEKINNLLLKHNIVSNIYIKKNSNFIEKNYANNIIFIDDYIPLSESFQNLKKSKFALDIHKSVQNGLTFRVFESIGLKKKLITTNKDIVNYDFYNPNNILIWNENLKEIPTDFLNNDYEQLSIEIYKKYSLENWVKTIFKI